MEVITDAYIGKEDTVIGDGAWIGMRAMIMPGITIGEGAIIASGAVVTKNVAPYTIVAGNPAQLVKTRFAQQIIDDLLALQLYEWPTDKFTKLQAFICAADIDILVEQALKYDLEHE